MICEASGIEESSQMKDEEVLITLIKTEMGMGADLSRGIRGGWQRVGKNMDQKAKESMISQGNVGDGKVMDGGEERSNNEDVVNHVHTPTMRPTRKNLRA